MVSGGVLEGASFAPQHSAAFRTRRFLNWFPLGLSYMLLYMGRYNLNVAKNALGALMTTEDFGIIFGAGTLVYGFSFVVNGPLTDKVGGRLAMLASVLGATVANLGMGLYIQNVVAQGAVDNATVRTWLSVLYAVNMYFQSFGAVAIVKVNAHWFHVRERGGFSGIFGTMISAGILMAFSVNGRILSLATRWLGGSEAAQARWVFFVPATVLFALFLVELFLLRDRPSDAGHRDFDTGDASSGEAEGEVPMFAVLKRILLNPVLITVALIEFCTGVLRQGIMQSYPFYAAGVLALPKSHFMRDGSDAALWWHIPFTIAAALLFAVAAKTQGTRRGWSLTAGGLFAVIPFLLGGWGWGGLLFVAGVIGGNVAGYVSDLFFHSRRAPAAGGLYALLVVSAIAMVFTMGTPTTVVDTSEVKEILSGDRIVAVAGQRDLKDWADVAKAYASVPATCLKGSRWDSKRNLCATEPEATDPSLAPSTGTIEIEVERAGQRLVLQVPDKKKEMRAGEQRTLKVTPVATLPPVLLGVVVFLMSLSVIGTHGLLSGTATMDFGGRKGAATAVGMIDGFVYLGTAVQSVSLGYLTAKSWSYWPWFLLPFSVVGFLLCLRIWNARPAPRKAG